MKYLDFYHIVTCLLLLLVSCSEKDNEVTTHEVVKTPKFTETMDTSNIILTDTVLKEVAGFYHGEGVLVNDSIFHNKWNYFNEKGDLIESVEYHYGLKNGWFVSYHSNGIPQLYGQYKDNLKTGDWITRGTDSILLSKEKFLKNSKSGYAIYYSKDGSPLREGHFINDLESGWWKYYLNDGNIHYVAEYKKGLKHGFYQEFSDGLLYCEGYYSLGKKVGYWNYYDKHGNIINKVNE